MPCRKEQGIMLGFPTVHNKEHRFSKFARATSDRAGRPWAFTLAALLVVVWLVTGAIFRFSDTWQLVMNTISSVVTFLMVFVIQNTQNTDGFALQLKLDELIKATHAQRDVIGVEEEP